MVDYFSPTVVRPSIPTATITPLELAVLSQMFESEPDGDTIYFFASEGPADTVRIDIEELKAALAACPETASTLADLVRKELAGIEPEACEIDLDLSDLGEAAIFRDIVRRCDQLDTVTIVSAWTCSKMRSDGFGGGITVVTAEHILSSSTAQLEGELLDRAEYGAVGRAPGHGSHVLLLLDEKHIRATLEESARLVAPDGVTADDVIDSDIREAALAVQASTDLSDVQGRVVFDAARAALQIAARRKETAH